MLYLHISLLRYYISMIISNNISLNNYFPSFCIYLITLMFIDIALLILSNLNNISFILYNITLLITSYIMLYNRSYPILLFDIFCILRYITLVILFLLTYISLYLIRLTIIILIYFSMYLYQFLPFSTYISLLFMYLFFSSLIFN
jgi:hypothetical protein